MRYPQLQKQGYLTAIVRNSKRLSVPHKTRDRGMEASGVRQESNGERGTTEKLRLAFEACAQLNAVLTSVE